MRFRSTATRRAVAWVVCFGVVALGGGMFPYPGTLLADSSHRRLKSALSLLRASSYLKELTWWAADARGGRLAGSEENYEAGQRAAERFARVGLTPLGDGGTFFQYFERGGLRRVKVGRELTVKGTQFRHSGAWSLVAGPPSCTLSEVPVAFAGYGIRAPEYNYDDFKGLKVAGKAVLILRYEPQERDGSSRFNGRRSTRHAALGTKVEQAVKAKAAAILLVNGPLHHDPDTDPLLPLGAGRVPRCSIPFLHIRGSVAAALLRESGRSLLELQNEIDVGEKPLSFVLPRTFLSLGCSVVVVRKARNVVALLGGSDPALREEVVVVGAHYDHIGRGLRGSKTPKRRGEVHNGADDNASGTVGVLELARAVTQAGLRPARSVLFVLFDAEEKGLLGSRHFVERPACGRSRIVAMINLDMIGHGEKGKCTVAGVGSAPQWEEILREAEEGEPLTFVHNRRGPGGSDHLSFLRSKIPSVFFCTGMHRFYHTPDDRVETINEEHAVVILRVVLKTLLAVADRPEALTFTEEVTSRAKLGVFLQAEQGRLVIGALQRGGGAEKAGLLPGDILLQVEEKPVSSVGEVRRALSRHKPGHVVRVGYERSGRRREADVVLTK